MSSKRPHILISNDDGINAVGIHALVKKLIPLADITVVAPDGPRSGASTAITSSNALRLSKVHEESGLTMYKLNGMPADCVKVALHVLFPNEKPDLVVTGINHGRNDAICVFYSGTLGSAREASIAGLPALAISLNNHDENADMAQAAELAYPIVEHMLSHSLPLHTLLSLNVPNTKVKGLRLCPQGVCKFVNEYEQRTDAQDRPVYWMAGYMEKTEPQEGTDFDYLNEGYATLTPMHLDLTDYTYLDTMKGEMANLVKSWEA